jgi:hypothetical protein
VGDVNVHGRIILKSILTGFEGMARIRWLKKGLVDMNLQVS